MKVCSQCSKEFETIFPDKLYCSQICKGAAARRRQGAKPLASRSWSIGQRFGRLTLVERVSPEGDGRQTWLCDCDCGAKRVVCRADKMYAKRQQSCGCLRLELRQTAAANRIEKVKERKHTAQKIQIEKDNVVRSNRAEVNSRIKERSEGRKFKDAHQFTRNSWGGARGRCLSPFSKAWPDYGGRGIRMCDHWIDSFDNFLKQMGDRPIGMTLDRIDPNGHYELSNCQWATPSQQAKNVRKHKKLFNGTEASKLRGFVRSVAWG
jgi:hypothetical protein